MIVTTFHDEWTEKDLMRLLRTLGKHEVGLWKTEARIQTYAWKTTPAYFKIKITSSKSKGKFSYLEMEENT